MATLVSSVFLFLPLQGSLQRDAVVAGTAGRLVLCRRVIVMLPARSIAPPAIDNSSRLLNS